MIKPQEHYLILDGARGVAALMVFLYHIKEFIFPELFHNTPYLLSKSYLAVDLFFLMSGIVLARAYGDRLASGKMSFSAFLIKRLLRLYPLYFLGLALGASYEVFSAIIKPNDPIHVGTLLVSFATNALFLPDYLNPKNIFALDPAAWSLSLEWIYGIIFALLLVKCKKVWIPIITVASAVGLIWAGCFYSTLDLGWGANNFHGGIIRIAFSFTLGVYLYKLTQTKSVKDQTFPALALLAITSITFINPFNVQSVLYDFIIVFTLLPLFAWLSCFASTPNILRKPFIVAGQTSYALYILHTPLILFMAGAWKFIFKQHPADMAHISLPVIILSIVGVSYLVTLLFDEPLRRFISNIIYNHQQPRT